MNMIQMLTKQILLVLQKEDIKDTVVAVLNQKAHKAALINEDPHNI
jgi:hypothetical protein